MYEYVSGSLVTLTDEHAIVEAGGIGYRIRIPLSTVTSLRGRQRAHLYTSLRLRDEILHLYGFGTLEEREIFEKLCTISGVGPGTAMAILSGIPLDEFREAVHQGQVKVLEAIKGIGRKTAQRLILELREVLVLSAAGSPAFSGAAEDAISALVAIGYTQNQAEQAVRLALAEATRDASLEDLVRLATRSRV